MACRDLEPALAAVADQYQGRVKVGKLDAYANAETAARFNVRGIPTLLLFKDGQVREEIVGLVSQDVITQAIDRHI